MAQRITKKLIDRRCYELMGAHPRRTRTIKRACRVIKRFKGRKKRNKAYQELLKNLAKRR